MADQKLTALSAIGSVTAEDLLYIVDDPSGTPVSRKVTLQTMTTAYLGSTGMTGGTVTASTPLLNHAQTWNNSGVTFTGWKLAIASSAGSAAASKLIDLTVAGATEFAVDKFGFITAENFTSTAQGLVPLSGGGTTNFLRADGTWTTPSVGGGLTVNTTTIASGTNLRILYDNAGTLGEYTATQATAVLDAFTSSLKGLAPSSGGGTTNFLRADGTWAAPAGGGGSPGGASLTIQYNNSSAFAGMSGTSWDDTNRSLTLTCLMH